MNMEPTSCPDELIAKERSAPLSELELHRLNAHCERCDACRIARQIGADFDDILAEPAETDAVDRIVTGAIATMEAARSLNPVLRKTPLSRYRAGVIAAVGVVLVSASAAAWHLGVRMSLPFLIEKSATSAVTIAPRDKPATSAPVTPSVTEETPEEGASAQAISQPTRDSSKNRISAIDLFTRASHARRSGQYSRAVALYMELQRKYPTSPEAHLSHVSMGRLLLHRLQEPQLALEHFQRYLMQSPQGSLSEEALYGQSMALMRLGKTREEADSWAEILRRNPRSVYEKIARERIAKLR